MLTQNEVTESGHDYADQLGVEYEYPAALYRNVVRSGEPFVYYRGRKRAGGGTQPQVYLGTGVVGQVRPSTSPGRLVCAIDDFELFAVPVPFKLDGAYLEPIGKVPTSKAGLYFRKGVREIEEATLERILTAAAATDPTAGRRRRISSMPYASPETAQLVDEVAVELARARLAEMHGYTAVRVMPHNNPGYDLRVDHTDGHAHYVEVKGTTRPFPHFFMSEGERRFSVANGSRYTLLIAYAIDIARRKGTCVTREGGLPADMDELRPTQWEGTFGVESDP